MSPRKKANESEQAAELEGGTATPSAATAASSRAGSFDILELNDLERGITPEDSEDVKWNYLSETFTHTVGTVNGAYWFKVDVGTAPDDDDVEEEPQ